MSLHDSDQSFPSRGGEIPPQWRGKGTFAGEFNLYDVGNLRSDFDHLNLFQGQKQHSVNIEH